MASLHFELVSPEKLLLSKEAYLVTVPGGEGDYGVLAGHAPMITTVRPGVIDVYEQQNGGVSERIFVCGGFAEVTAERCTVLAEEAMPLSELNRAELEKQSSDLGEDLDLAKTPGERAAIEIKLNLVKAKLAAADGH
jgi:F-type H+-transporting ATPase subunit epsilon